MQIRMHNGCTWLAMTSFPGSTPQLFLHLVFLHSRKAGEWSLGTRLANNTDGPYSIIRTSMVAIMVPSLHPSLPPFRGKREGGRWERATM